MTKIVVIGGCGHVGLPLGLAFAKAGHSVVGLDIDAAKVAQTNQGRMPFFDRGADELLREVLASKKFHCSLEAELVAEAEVVVTIIGTPLDEHLNPRFEVYKHLLDHHRSHMRAGQLLILRSTVYPGTTQRVWQELERQKAGIDVAFCPERVAEGVALEEIHSLPQLVAGTTPRAQKRAEELFRCLTHKVIALSPLEAELAKLFTNSWRYIQFATSNQFYMMANDFGADFYAIQRAMTEDYPRAKGFPRPGFAAGPCLFKDTMQLSAFDNNAFFLGHAAMLVNEGLPNYVVRRASLRWDLRDMTVGILGMTFKADSDDPRDSLSFKLRKILLAEAREVLCADPFLSDPRLVPQADLLARAKLLFIGAPHRIYRDLDTGDVPVIDIWKVTKKGTSIL
jgi:UDP-N-acetyl-D-mannosaminuronic acid dehydrogenase